MQIGEWPTSIAYAKSVGSGLLMTEVTSVRRYVIKRWRKTPRYLYIECLSSLYIGNEKCFLFRCHLDI